MQSFLFCVYFYMLIVSKRSYLIFMWFLTAALGLLALYHNLDLIFYLSTLFIGLWGIMLYNVDFQKSIKVFYQVLNISQYKLRCAKTIFGFLLQFSYLAAVVTIRSPQVLNGADFLLMMSTYILLVNVICIAGVIKSAPIRYLISLLAVSLSLLSIEHVYIVHSASFLFLVLNFILLWKK